MKATIEFDDVLYRRLKVEAAKRGRTVRDMVSEGVRSVLDGPASGAPPANGGSGSAWRPDWLGALAKYGDRVDDHSMAAVRESIARKAPSR